MKANSQCCCCYCFRGGGGGGGGGDCVCGECGCGEPCDNYVPWALTSPTELSEHINSRRQEGE